MGLEIAWEIAAAVVGLWLGLSCRLDEIGDRGGRALIWAAGAMVWIALVVAAVAGAAFWGLQASGRWGQSMTAEELWGQAAMVGLLGSGVGPMVVGGWVRKWGAEGATSARILGVMRWSGPFWVVAIGAGVWALSGWGDGRWSGAEWRWGVSVVLGVGLGMAMALIFRWGHQWRGVGLGLGLLAGAAVAHVWGAQTVLAFLVAGVWLSHATERGEAVGEVLARFVGVVAAVFGVAIVMSVEWSAVLDHWEAVVALTGGRALALGGLWLWWTWTWRDEQYQRGLMVGGLVAQDLVVLVMAGSLWLDGGLSEVLFGAVVVSTSIYVVMGLGGLQWSLKQSGEDRVFALHWRQGSQPSEWRNEGLQAVKKWEREQGVEAAISGILEHHIQGVKSGGDAAPRGRHDGLDGLGLDDEGALRVVGFWEGLWEGRRQEDVAGLMEALEALELEAGESTMDGLAMRFLRHLGWALEEREAIGHQLWAVGRGGADIEGEKWEALEKRREGFEEGWRRGLVEAVVEELESDEGWTWAQRRRGRELLGERFEAHQREASRIWDSLRLDWEINRWRRWGERFLEQVSAEIGALTAGEGMSAQRSLDRRWWGGWWLEEMEEQLGSVPRRLVVYRALPADWRGQRRDVWHLELRRWLELRLRREMALTMVELRDRLIEQIEAQAWEEGFEAGWVERLRRHLEASLKPLERRDVEEVCDRLDGADGERGAPGEQWVEIVAGPFRTVATAIRGRWASVGQRRAKEEQARAYWKGAARRRAQGVDEGYLRHFSTAPVEITDHYVEREVEGELLREVQGMLQKGSGPLLVSGDPGVGRRSLVRHVAEARRREGTEVMWLQAVLRGDERWLKRRGQRQRLTVEEAMEWSEAQDEALVVVEGTERWLRRTPDDLEVMEGIWARVEQGLRGGWIWVMEENARRWLAAAQGVDSYMGQHIRVEAWSRDELEALIMARHQGSGRAVRFERRPRGTGERIERWWQGSGQRWGKQGYFDRLHRLSCGRADAALRWWKASLRGEQEKGTLVVRALKEGAEIDLRERDREEVWMLCCLALHGGMGMEELVALSGCGEAQCGRWLRRLQERGWVDERGGREGGFRLAVMARGRIEEALKNEGWL